MYFSYFAYFQDSMGGHFRHIAMACLVEQYHTSLIGPCRRKAVNEPTNRPMVKASSLLKVVAVAADVFDVYKFSAYIVYAIFIENLSAESYPRMSTSNVVPTFI